MGIIFNTRVMEGQHEGWGEIATGKALAMTLRVYFYIPVWRAEDGGGSVGVGILLYTRVGRGERCAVVGVRGSF